MDRRSNDPARLPEDILRDPFAPSSNRNPLLDDRPDLPQRGVPDIGQFDYGRQDLGPPGFGAPGGGGGFDFDPFRHQPRFNPNNPGQLPPFPGARFDPTGPLGGGPRGPRAPFPGAPGTGGPNPDQAPMPNRRWNDPFI